VAESIGAKYFSAVNDLCQFDDMRSLRRAWETGAARLPVRGRYSKIGADFQV
jgi:hypothetical protein